MLKTHVFPILTTKESLLTNASTIKIFKGILNLLFRLNYKPFRHSCLPFNVIEKHLSNGQYLLYIHRIVEWFGLEWTLEDHLVPTPLPWAHI